MESYLLGVTVGVNTAVVLWLGYREAGRWVRDRRDRRRREAIYRAVAAAQFGRVKRASLAEPTAG